MIVSIPFWRPRPSIGFALVAVFASAPVALFAQSAPAPGPTTSSDTVRLSDEQRLAILDHTTPESAAAARGEMPAEERKTLGIHGEVGAMIGSNGTRGLYGVAQIPLGDSAAATVSFESSRFGYPRQSGRR
ncbi:hypothetical protein [Sphingomonas sp. UYP23]